jgi:hypothetical protein
MCFVSKKKNKKNINKPCPVAWVRTKGIIKMLELVESIIPQKLF